MKCDVFNLINEKTHTSYSDKFILRVVNLNQIDSATEEDKANRLDYWARLFTAVTWEEIIMITKNDSVLSSASQSLYELNADEILRQKCLAREDYNKTEQALQKFSVENKLLKQELAKKDAALVEKDAALVEKDARIKALEKALAKTRE